MKWRLILFIFMGMIMATIFVTCIGLIVYDYKSENTTLLFKENFNR
jgi:hypothetical protein